MTLKLADHARIILRESDDPYMDYKRIVELNPEYAFNHKNREHREKAVLRDIRRSGYFDQAPEPRSPYWKLKQQGSQIQAVQGFAPQIAETIEVQKTPIVKDVGLVDEHSSNEARWTFLFSDEAGLPYEPQDVDSRHLLERQIKERRGQQKFRNALRKRYGDRCLVTGCQVLDVLEAAHIKPYRGENDNNPENGLLLRADLHTLFDLDLLGIEPTHLRIELHSDIAEYYGHLNGKTLGCVGNVRPSHQALDYRYGIFKQRVTEAVK